MMRLSWDAQALGLDSFGYAQDDGFSGLLVGGETA
jgi:hypothetical protein